MGAIDSILNLAGVLLWFSWRSAQVTARERPSPVSLAATLRKADPRRGGRWLSLGSLLAVLGARSIFYWNVGSAWNWTPSLELGLISLPFRSDHFSRMLLFSTLSFALVLGALYTWLLLLSVVNQRVPDDNRYQRLVRMQLGWVEHLPPWAKLLLPLVVVGLVWALGSPGLVRLGIVPKRAPGWHTWEEGLFLGLTSYLTLEPFILGVCLLYLANSYVYLGNAPFWHFVNATGGNLLSPLRHLPLQIGKVDLSPLAMIAIVVILSRWIGWWLPKLFQRLPL